MLQMNIDDLAELWHYRLGHLYASIHKCLSFQFPYVSYKSKAGFPCDICHFSKKKVLPYSNSNSKGTHIFELLHYDIWGPYATPSIYDHIYFLTLVDDFNRFTWIILMKLKSETRQHLKILFPLLKASSILNLNV